MLYKSDELLAAESELRRLGISYDDTSSQRRIGVYRARSSYMYYKFPSSFYSFEAISPAEVFGRASGGRREIVLYTHIPFCVRKCAYCFYYSCTHWRHPDVEEYISLVKKELSLLSQWVDFKSVKVKRLYIGGGSPTILSCAQAMSLIRFLKDTLSFVPNAQLCFEVEPVSSYGRKDLFTMLHDESFNFISIGVQSFGHNVLKTIKRDTNTERILQTIAMIRSCGLSEINVDMLLDLPGETVQTWEKGLSLVIKEGIPSLTVNTMIINRLQMYRFFHLQRDLFPSSGDLLRMMAMTKTMLQKAGYTCFFCSLYKKNAPSQYDPLYVDDSTDILSLGPRTWSCWNNVEYYNSFNLPRYIKKLRQGQLPVWIGKTIQFSHRRMQHAISARLLSAECVDLAEYDIHKKQAFLRKCAELQKQGCMRILNGERVQLTEKGVFLFFRASRHLMRHDWFISWTIFVLDRLYPVGYCFFWLKEKDVPLFLYDVFARTKAFLKNVFLKVSRERLAGDVPLR